MPGSATESDYIEQLDEARKECARERERRMELERALRKAKQGAEMHASYPVLIRVLDSALSND